MSHLDIVKLAIKETEKVKSLNQHEKLNLILKLTEIKEHLQKER